MARNLISKINFHNIIYALIDNDAELKELNAKLMAFGKKAKRIEISDSYHKGMELMIADLIRNQLKASMKLLLERRRITLDKKVL